MHGEQGEVVGPATSESHKGKGVEVRFPGNKGTVSCYLNQVRRRCHVQLSTAPRRPSCPSSPAHPQCTVWAHR